MALQNIKLNNVKALDAKLYTDEYFDFMLYKGEAFGIANEDACLATSIDLNDENCYTEDGGIKSNKSWDGAINNGVTLNNIGFTSVDNGLTVFDKDTISNKDFYNLFFNSELEIPSGDTAFKMYPVTGNTKEYCYDLSLEEENEKKYIALKGGFFQGFFKAFGYDYQTLPDYIESDWHFEFVIRPRSDYELCKNSLNNKHPENAGTFFYIGTRAENKFGEIYNGTYVPKFLGSKDDIKGIDTSAVEDTRTDYYEIETDNKFMFFNRTKTGFTVHNWDKTIDSVLFSGYKRKEYPENAFVLFNRTCTGWTVKDAIKYLDNEEPSENSYDMNKDVLNNAFSLKYNTDGSLSYNYTVKDCDDERGWSIKSETTKPGLIKDNEWNVINVRFAIVDNSAKTCVSTDENGNTVYKKVLNNVGSRKMRIMVYINGYLVLISKELPEFNFRALNDSADKQEGVPFNISLGGGTQGLGEKIWLNFRDKVTKHYELEKNYGGSFAGDIQAFKMFDCMQNYETIKANYKKYMGLYSGQTKEDYNYIYIGTALNEKELVNRNNKITEFSDCQDEFTVTSKTDNAHLYLLLPINNVKVKQYNSISIGDVNLNIEKYTISINNVNYKVYKSKAVYSSGKILKIKGFKD